MAWTATVSRKERDITNGWLMVYFRLREDDGRDIIVPHRLNGPIPTEWIERTAKMEINRLTAIDSGDANIEIGNISDPVPENIAEINFKIFQKRFNKLARLSPILQISPTLRADADVQQLLSRIETDIKTYWNRF